MTMPVPNPVSSNHLDNVTSSRDLRIYSKYSFMILPATIKQRIAQRATDMPINRSFQFSFTHASTLSRKGRNGNCRGLPEVVSLSSLLNFKPIY